MVNHVIKNERIEVFLMRDIFIVPVMQQSCRTNLEPGKALQTFSLKRSSQKTFFIPKLSRNAG